MEKDPRVVDTEMRSERQESAVLDVHNMQIKYDRAYAEFVRTGSTIGVPEKNIRAYRQLYTGFIGIIFGDCPTTAEAASIYEETMRRIYGKL